MFYAFLSALFSALFASGYKVATLAKARRPVTNSVMYIVATSFLLGGGLVWGGLTFTRELVFFGVIAGLAAYLSTVAFFQVMRYGRLAIQWTVINMAVAVPTAAAIVLWNERPTPLILTGMGLAVAALVLMGVDKGANALQDKGEAKNHPTASRAARSRWLGLIVVAFLTTGLAQLCYRAHVEYGPGTSHVAYLLTVYASAAACGVLHLLLGRFRPSRPELGLGLYMAVTSMGTVWALLRSLEQLPAVVLFPFRGVVCILTTALLSVLLWREKLHWQARIGIAVATTAIVCLTLGGR